MGINEAISIPRPFIQSGRYTAAQEAAELAADAASAVGLGAGWVRGNSPVYPYWDMLSRERAGDWSRPDRWVRAMQDTGLRALVVLGPWPGNRTANFTDSYPPPDLAAYHAYITGLVERYDGDGVDDMPGLTRPIRHWEVDNEPDLHNQVPPKGAKRQIDPKSFETAEEYAALLLTTAAAIKAADPGATVLSAGIYRPRDGKGRAYFAKVMATPGVLDAIDGVSLHCYFDADDTRAIVATMAAARAHAPGKPVWITETGVPGDGRKRHTTPEWQAEMLVRLHGAFWAEGASRVFWHTLSSPPGRAMGKATFASHGLLQVGVDGKRQPKPAAEAYRRLADHMARATTLQDVPAQGGRLLWTGAGWLAWEGAPTVPEGGATVVDLLSGTHTDAGSSVVAPALILPAPSP